MKRDWWSVGLLVGCLGLTFWLTETYRVATFGAHLTSYALYGLAIACLLVGCLTTKDRLQHTLLGTGVIVLVVATPLVARSSLVYTQTNQHYIPQQWLEFNMALPFLASEDAYARVHALARVRSQVQDQSTLAQFPFDLTAYYQLYGTTGGMSALRHRGAELQNASADERVPEGSMPLTRMSGVRWIVSGFVAEENRSLRLLGTFLNRDGLTYVYEVPDPLPRAFVPPAVEYVADGGRLLRKNPDFEPSALALVDVKNTSKEGLLGQKTPSGPGSVRIVSYRNEQVELIVRMEQPGWVVLSDTFYPGWRAALDGKPAEIYQANYLFRAVFVPEGEHVIVFKYLPSRLLWGLGTMGISLVIALLLARSLARLPGIKNVGSFGDTGV